MVRESVSPGVSRNENMISKGRCQPSLENITTDPDTCVASTGWRRFRKIGGGNRELVGGGAGSIPRAYTGYCIPAALLRFLDFFTEVTKGGEARGFCIATDMMLSIQSRRNEVGSISTGCIMPSLNNIHLITTGPCTKLLMAMRGCHVER